MLHTSRVLFERYGLYTVGSLQWALKFCGKQIMLCLSVQDWGTFIGLLVLNHSDVAGMTLTSQPHGPESHEGQFTPSGW